jgi:hypothetical protein
MVEDDHPQRAVARLCESRPHRLQLACADAARLVTPRSHRVDADDVEAVRGQCRLRRLPLALELGPRPREPRGKRVRDVVVPGNGEQRQPEAAQEARGPFMLLAAAAVREVAARDEKRGLRALHEERERPLHRGILLRPDVQIGHVEDPPG